MTKTFKLSDSCLFINNSIILQYYKKYIYVQNAWFPKTVQFTSERQIYQVIILQNPHSISSNFLPFGVSSYHRAKVPVCSMKITLNIKYANTGLKIITEFVAWTFEWASADGLDIFCILDICGPSSVILCNVTGFLICLHLRLFRWIITWWYLFFI